MVRGTPSETPDVMPCNDGGLTIGPQNFRWCSPQNCKLWNPFARKEKFNHFFNPENPEIQKKAWNQFAVLRRVEPTENNNTSRIFLDIASLMFCSGHLFSWWIFHFELQVSRRPDWWKPNPCSKKSIGSNYQVKQVQFQPHALWSNVDCLSKWLPNPRFATSAKVAPEKVTQRIQILVFLYLPVKMNINLNLIWRFHCRTLTQFNHITGDLISISQKWGFLRFSDPKKIPKKHRLGVSSFGVDMLLRHTAQVFIDIVSLSTHQIPEISRIFRSPAQIFRSTNFSWVFPKFFWIFSKPLELHFPIVPGLERGEVPAIAAGDLNWGWWWVPGWKIADLWMLIYGFQMFFFFHG